MPFYKNTFTISFLYRNKSYEAFVMIQSLFVIVIGWGTRFEGIDYLCNRNHCCPLKIAKRSLK